MCDKQFYKPSSLNGFIMPTISLGASFENELEPQQ